MNIKKVLAAVFVTLLFFVAALFTLKDYGISWDEPLHFHRGQAYLYYFLTGKTQFDEKSKWSYYQHDNLNAEYFFIKDDGHPPLNGILASLFNFIFFEKLGVLGDIEAYHLFNIFVSALLVTAVVLFASETYGIFAGIISGIIVATYPLFFAESHFNIKDPAQTTFFTLTIWAFWKSLKDGWRWLLVSAIAAGFALGTKFNILFLPLIIFPYLAIRYIGTFKKIPRTYVLTLLISPFIVFGIFFGSWPYLWQDPIANLISSFRWYQDIGTGQATYGIFIPGGFNLFAPFWILITTPPLVIFLLFIGIFTAIRNRSEYGWVPILWLLWFFIPIARVVVPDTTIYGGVRQIMEFLPAMALLAGLGAAYLARGNIKIIIIITVITVIFLLSPIVRLHPNENVYFNFIIGGLAGAKEKGIPYWGNSFGNAYWQAVQWLNQNAPEGSKIALIQGTTLNIPKISLRKDIRFSNSFWSGIYRDGEYLIELTHHDKRVYPYAWEYAERFLEPVFEVKVEGVPIAKVWKNDLEHTKEEFRKKEVVFNEQIKKSMEGSEIILDTGREVFLTRLVIFYEREKCEKSKARVLTSMAEEWFEEPEGIPANQLTVREKEEKPFEVFFFPGRYTRLIKLQAGSSISCILDPRTSFIVYKLEDLR